MQKEILDLIDKDLPNQVGTVLKKKLEQAEKDAITVEQQSKDIEIYRKDIKTLTRNGVALRDELNEHRKLDEKLISLEQRERELEVAKLNIMLKAEKEKSNFMNSVTMGLVRNVEYRQSIHDSKFKSIPVTDQYGGTRFEPESHTNTYSKVEEVQ